MTASWSPPLQVLSRRVTLSGATTILPDVLLTRPLIRLKLLHLGAVHVLHNLVRLPFLEAETQTLVRVVLIVRLILVVLDLDEVAVDGGRVQRQGDEGIDGGGFGNDFESPRLVPARVSVDNEKSQEESKTPTCSFLNWIKPGSFFTIWYFSVLLSLNSFGRANHWPAILYRSFAYTNWSSYTQSDVYRCTFPTVGLQL